MKAKGFEITGQAIDDAFFLLAKLMGVEAKVIKNAVRQKPGYKTVLISKGRGKGERRLDIPPLELRKVQKCLLRKCLRHIIPPSAKDWAMLTGYKPRRCIRDNLMPHIRGRAFLQLDLTDAFPTVTTEMVRKALTPMLKEASVKNMFHFRSVRWFRRRFLERKDDVCDDMPDEASPLDILYALREIIL